MILKLLKIFIVTLFVLAFIPVPTTQASGNFATNYNVLYTINQNGTTHAILKVGLTNKTSEYYASSYKIQVGFDQITNVHASDPEGPINPVIEKTDDGYTISLNFNKKATGLGKQLNFTISFDTQDVAKEYGKIWEINIPGIADPEEFDSFAVELKVPPSFGKPTYTKPYQPLNSLVFNKQQLGKSGISLSFGDRQFYSFHLTYHLKNDNLYPVNTEIAIPQTTNYQTVFVQNIQPRPENVKIDTDGNWLAVFRLGPSQKQDVVVDGKVEIFLTPKQEELAPADMQKYLDEQPYWQTKAPEIKELAQELKTPDAIYKFVVKALKYDFSRVTDDKPRLGALNSLKNPDSAVCLEYTDLFIALARAAGIPAREIDGFANAQNSRQRPLSLVKDILHAWPEYYDTEKKTWIMVDPTWGSTTGGVDYFTTLDFDHFTFATKGVDSNYPIPAGGYKYISDKYTKDVSVNFAENLPSEEHSFDIISGAPADAMSAFPIKNSIMLKNTGQTLLPPQDLIITSTVLLPKSQTVKSAQIPPFGSANLAFTFEPQPFLTNKSTDFTIRAGNQTITKSIEISPLLIKKWWKVGGGIFIAILCIIILVITIRSRGLPLSRRRK